MGGLFKSPKPVPVVQPPPPAPPPPMPDQTSAPVLEAQRKAAEKIMQRAGRHSTILSAENDARDERLGGGAVRY